jgi:hypothetical protein
MRNSAIVSEASRLYLERLRKVDPEKLSPEIRNVLYRKEGTTLGMGGEWVPVPDDELDPYTMYDNRIIFRDMKSIPADILKKAKRTVQENKDGMETAGEIVEREPPTGTDETPELDEDLENDFERDLAIENSIRNKGGANLSKKEREYLEQLSELREIG